MANATCTVAGCTRPIKRVGFCYGHYMKNWRYGTPEPEHSIRRADLVGKTFGSLVVQGYDRATRKWSCTCACGATLLAGTTALTRRGQRSCQRCAGRARRQPDAGYGSAHRRVRTERGPATDHRCVDCGKAAAHWSYDHADPDELIATDGAHPIAYSLSSIHYEPRCVPCHKRFDLDRTDAARTIA